MSSLLRVIFDPDTTPPGVPTIISVTPVGQNRLDIVWTAVVDTGGAGLAGYDLLRDGVTVISLGIQTSFSDTGLATGSSHTYRVRSRDAASPTPNVSNYSAQAAGTVASAPAIYNPDYPRFGSYAIGGTQNATTAALAECHVNVVAYGATWAQRKGITLEAKAAAVKALSTIGTKILPYVIHVDALDSWGVAGASGNDFFEWYTILGQNNWFVYTNGLTHTTKVVGSATGWSKPNYTTSCPVVAGDTAFTWKAKWDYRLLYTGGTFFNGVATVTVAGTSSLDGKYDDNIFARERSNGDYDVDGVSDSVSSVANIALIQGSHAANAVYWRTLAPSDSIIMANCADWPIWYPGGLTGNPLDQVYDGGVLENIDDFINGTRASTASALFGAIKVCQDAFRGAKLGVLEIQITAATNYAQLRYWHCVTALTGTYYYPHVDSGYLAEELGTLNYDERRFNLGPATAGTTGAVQWTPLYQSGTNGTGIYRRDFANGIVLWAAPGATYTAQALGGTFYRLVGTLDGTTNNGQSLTSVTMTAGTGLVLARTSQDTIAPSTPSSLAASAVSSSQINLTWNASTDTGGSGLSTYRIERSPNGTSGWAEIGTATTTSYSDSSGVASTQYFYRVRARDGIGNNSAYSNVANATTQAGSGSSTAILDDFESGTVRIVSAANSGYPSGGGSNPLWVNYAGEGAAATVTAVAGIGRFGGFGLRYRMTAGSPYFDFEPIDNQFQYFMHEQLTSGTWSKNKFNRLGFWVFLPSNLPLTTDPNRQAVEIGTYVRKEYNPSTDGLTAWRTDPEMGGWHFYHFVTPRTGVWTYIVLDEHPQHSRESSAGSGKPVGNPGAMNGIGTNIWPTTTVGWNYVDALGRIYFNDWRTTPSSFPCDIIFDHYTLFNEADIGDVDHIASLEASYDASTQLLHIGFCRNPSEDPTFTARWSATSMKGAGFASGTLLGTVGPDGNGGYVNKKIEGTVNLGSLQRVFIAVYRTGAPTDVFREIELPLGSVP